MTRRKPAPQAVRVHCDPNVDAAFRVAADALRRWSAYCDSHPQLHVAVEQAGGSLFARFRSTYEAWLRHAPWATIARLQADAAGFASFVHRETRPIAPVLRLVSRGGA